MFSSSSYHLRSIHSVLEGGAQIQVNAERSLYSTHCSAGQRCSSLYYNFILIARLMITGFCVRALSPIRYNWEIMLKEGGGGHRPKAILSICSLLCHCRKESRAELKIPVLISPTVTSLLKIE